MRQTNGNTLRMQAGWGRSHQGVPAPSRRYDISYPTAGQDFGITYGGCVESVGQGAWAGNRGRAIREQTLPRVDSGATAELDGIFTGRMEEVSRHGENGVTPVCRIELKIALASSRRLSETRPFMVTHIRIRCYDLVQRSGRWAFVSEMI